jgi:hypothetical protein
VHSKRYMYRLVPSMPLFFLHWNIIAPFRRILVHGVVVLVSRSVRVSLHLLIFIIHASIHLRAHHMTVHVLVLQVACHKMEASEVDVAL